MKIETLVYDKNQWIKNSGDIDETQLDNVDIVFIFGNRDAIKNSENLAEIKQRYKNAKIVGSSTSGNINASEVSSYEIIATAISFEKSSIEVASICFNEEDDVEELSKELVSKLKQENLKHIFVISDGLLINGSSLTRGINKVTKNISVTGGMAGDGDKFEETYVVVDTQSNQRTIVAVGFYGNDLTIDTGCFAGWSEFGAQRIITKSKDNILYEIDNEPALDLYKKYLGSLASDLPNSGLRFPLSIKKDENSSEVIRTLLGINEEDKSITFAGDVPVGYKARLMKADIDLLIEGAGEAAKSIKQTNDKTALGLVVSCVGRKIVMNYLVDDELEAVQNILGKNVVLSGFYSYGEIAPFKNNKINCELHNQTMTLTVIYES
ncbi:MAG: FIST signal transduction protein [Poseidonibacter sp.]|uniref:FIST signal transduction protein n=1 Tax=Poseidonibacter sp. TaxID=2321188 RepID=UPI00359EE26F